MMMTCTSFSPARQGCLTSKEALMSKDVKATLICIAVYLALYIIINVTEAVAWAII